MAADLVEDLVELERLADAEPDDPRRRRLLALHDRLAERAQGAKVAEAAAILGISVPTVKSWIDAGLLREVTGARPARVSYASLAGVRRALEEIRSAGGDRGLLVAVGRWLRDRAATADAEHDRAVEDLKAGRTAAVTPAELDELIPGSRPRPRSTSR